MEITTLPVYGSGGGGSSDESSVDWRGVADEAEGHGNGKAPTLLLNRWALGSEM
jgi:hypothetical protein